MEGVEVIVHSLKSCCCCFFFKLNLDVHLLPFLFCKVQETALNWRSVFKTHFKVHQLCKHTDFVIIHFQKHP